MTASKGTGRGQHPASRENLEEGRMVKHGWWSRGIQTTGVPVRRSCPLRLLSGCDCKGEEGDPCPVMLQRFVDRATELREEGVSGEASELITRLEQQSALGHFAMAVQGYFREDGKSGALKAHALWKSVGCTDHALERLYRAAGILRTGTPLAPGWKDLLQGILEALREFPEARAHVAEALAEEAEVEEADREDA